MSRKLIKGNEAAIFGAILGGSTHYFGYPITPASEMAHAAARYFPACGRHFLQAECEVASINMIYGAAGAGARPMTGTSGPGLSLMAEGLSYLAAAELPCVVVDVQRAGPGLGNIFPAQGDYNCTVKGGGHGDYHCAVLAPESAQEMCDFAYHGFEIAEKYRSPVIILADACIGQLMEPVELPATVRPNPVKDWAVYGDARSRPNLISSIFMDPQAIQAHNQKLQAKYLGMAQEITSAEEFLLDDAEFAFVAFGICARICKSSVRLLRQQGIRAGVFRPKSLFPFPSAAVEALAGRVARLVTVELNSGHMFEDVRLATGGRAPTSLYSWSGGMVPTAEEIAARLTREIAGARV
jgi:pyruvate/2-oxoacid:ferredoxin oxidoreductase alpha subunit